jgi:hypothetical protein
MSKANKNKKEPIFERDELEGELKEKEEKFSLSQALANIDEAFNKPVEKDEGWSLRMDKDAGLYYEANNIITATSSIITDNFITYSRSKKALEDFYDSIEKMNKAAEATEEQSHQVTLQEDKNKLNENP